MSKRIKSCLTGLLATSLLWPLAASHAADLKDRTLKIATAQVKEHPFSMGAQKFADLLSEKTRRQDERQAIRGGRSGRGCAGHLFAPGRYRRRYRGQYRAALGDDQGVRAVLHAAGVQ